MCSALLLLSLLLLLPTPETATAATAATTATRTTTTTAAAAAATVTTTPIGVVQKMAQRNVFHIPIHTCVHKWHVLPHSHPHRLHITMRTVTGSSRLPGFHLTIFFDMSRRLAELRFVDGTAIWMAGDLTHFIRPEIRRCQRRFYFVEKF